MKTSLKNVKDNIQGRDQLSSPIILVVHYHGSPFSALHDHFERSFHRGPQIAVFCSNSEIDLPNHRVLKS